MWAGIMTYLCSFLHNMSIVSSYCNEYSKYKIRLLGMIYGAVALTPGKSPLPKQLEKMIKNNHFRTLEITK